MKKYSIRLIYLGMVLTVFTLLGCPNQSQQLTLFIGIATDGTGSGTIDTTASTTNGSYDAGTAITAQAAANTGCSCVGWFDAESGGTLVSADNPYVFDLTAETSLYAKFEETVAPSVAVVNLRDKGVVESGFLIGTAGDNTELSVVEVKLDGGSYAAATGTASWIFQLPTGSSTWRDGTEHTISVRSRDSAGNYSDEILLTVRKGVNKDVNGDGYADLAVGARGYSSSTGRAYVYHGSISGIAAAASRTLEGETAGDSFGSSIALGDANGDGYADLAVGAEYYDNFSLGRAYVYHGSSSGIAAIASRTLTGETNNNYFGSSVALGDANGDGYADLSVAARGYSSSTGRAYVFHGGSTGIAAAESRTLDGETAGDAFGVSLSLGDVNGDGYADLAVCAWGYSSYTGRAYVYHGGSSGIEAAPASQTLDGETAGDAFGSSIALGDANGDGYADLAVGASNYSSVTGRAYVYHGSGSGIAAIASRTLTGETTSIEFGSSAALGDANGDGYADLAVGALYYNSQTGRAYVYHGGSSGIAAAASRMLDGEATSNSFGGAVAF